MARSLKNRSNHSNLKKLEETIKKVEDNNIYNGFNINEHNKNVESLREFYSYWSIHAEKV